MDPLSEKARSWIRWCHADQPLYVAEGAIETITRMVHYSPYPNPLVLVGHDDPIALCRGYAVACEGAIAYLGRLRYATHRRGPSHEATPGEASSTQEQLRDDRFATLSGVLSQLCRESLALDVELIQAILPANDDRKHNDEMSQVFRESGMTYAARLLQMECDALPLEHDASPVAYDFLPLQLHPYEEMPWDPWCRLVEQTYVGTLDVPILNGVRSIENTLRGYAVGIPNDQRHWWSIHLDSVPIGCLMLTPVFEHDCELTYLGLIPEARGHRYSPEILDFVSRWMMEHRKQRIVLAVDELNAPAIHLYGNFGFRETQAIDAWFRCNKSLASPF